MLHSLPLSFTCPTSTSKFQSLDSSDSNTLGCPDEPLKPTPSWLLNEQKGEVTQMNRQEGIQDVKNEL